MKKILFNMFYSIRTLKHEMDKFLLLGTHTRKRIMWLTPKFYVMLQLGGYKGYLKVLCMEIIFQVRDNGYLFIFELGVCYSRVHDLFMKHYTSTGIKLIKWTHDKVHGVGFVPNRSLDLRSDISHRHKLDRFLGLVHILGPTSLELKATI
ncbi:hypothetical protein ACJX0J_036847 [Zea mays]